MKNNYLFFVAGTIAIFLGALTGSIIAKKYIKPEVIETEAYKDNVIYYMTDCDLNLEDGGKSIVLYSQVSKHGYKYISLMDTLRGTEYNIPLFKRKDVYTVKDGKIVFDKKYKGEEKTKTWIEWEEF